MRAQCYAAFYHLLHVPSIYETARKRVIIEEIKQEHRKDELVITEVVKNVPSLPGTAIGVKCLIGTLTGGDGLSPF